MSTHSHARLYIAPFYYDDDLIQCQIFASNGAYSGYAEPYFSRDSFQTIGEMLLAFPDAGINSEVSWNFCETTESPDCSLKFFIRDSVGHACIRVTLRRRLKETEEASFLFDTEVVAINHLGSQLCEIATKDKVTEAITLYQNE